MQTPVAQMSEKASCDPKLLAKKLESPTSLTEFAPLSSEVKQHGSRFSFSRLMKWNSKSSKQMSNHENPSAPYLDKEYFQPVSYKVPLCASESSTPSPPCLLSNTNEHSDSDVSLDQWTSLQVPTDVETHDPLTHEQDTDLPYKRNVGSVLRRIANILDRKGGQTCKESDFKQYWMPDSNCKECYECGSKFTTLRRRHHCRICGQIFCSSCCKQEISGKVMGFSGCLRVCSYCFNIVQSLNVTEPLSDLMAIQDDLQQKLSQLNSSSETCIPSEGGNWTTVRRKSSMGFREEDIARAKSSIRTEIELGNDYATHRPLSPERRTALQANVTLQDLWKQILKPGNGIEFQSHHHHGNCVYGSVLVSWMIQQGIASSRSTAAAIGQALVDAKYLERIACQEQIFSDNFILFRPNEQTCVSTPPLLPIVETLNSSGSQDGQEPLWVKEIQTTDSSASFVDTDDSTEVLNHSSEMLINKDQNPGKLRTSASTFHLDLNIKDSCVRVSKPSHSIHHLERTSSLSLEFDDSEDPVETELAGKAQLKSVSSNTDEMVKGALPLENPDEQQITPRSWLNSQHLKDGSEEKSAYNRMNSAYDTLEQTLLTQLLNAESLSLSWANIVIPLVHQVTEMVRPDVKYDSDDMDIRQYVQIKKIPGGNKSESCIVNGVVCTKNVAHKKMKQKLVNPTILLLSSSIVYQRVEKKLSSLDPIIMQENEYLKNVVAKISVYKPDLLLVEKTVSRVAQEMLLDLDITLALNVKPSVMERVARCTQAGIVSSIDAQLGKPHLGVCHHFSVQTFNLPNNETKTLMFFDGCASHLGCTILLRGGSASELSKVKAICQFMVYVTYNWRLERSFLMDEFALPPPHLDDLPIIMDAESTENVLDTIADQVLKLEGGKCVAKRSSGIDLQSTQMSNSCGQHAHLVPIKNINSSDEKLEQETCTNLNDTHASLHVEVNNCGNNKDNTSAHEICGGEDSGKRLESKSVEDFSDPLHFYLQSGDDSIFQNHQNHLQVEFLPFANRFRKALDDTILCCSPFIKMPLPYLETESGQNCKSRTFFPKDIYWSAQFMTKMEAGTRKKNSELAKPDSPKAFSSRLPFASDAVEILPWHPFTFQSITSLVQFSVDIQSQLADFRARGGRIRLWCPHNHAELIEQQECKTEEKHQMTSTLLPGIPNSQLETDVNWDKKVDALNPCNHQHLMVLFCSYSSDSCNAPNFCVSPWVVRMDFYGQNDISLGGFLERYCFRSTYLCPSTNCDTPMTEHIRKFVHDNGCIHIILRKVDNLIPAAQNNILMWSWCNRCKQSTPYVPMSDDTWSLSFAKYLELRFHGNQYTRRGAEKCQHSLHHEHYQFFAHKQVVALFKYNTITMREVVWPSLIIDVKDDPIPLSSIIEEIKFLAVRGYGVYSEILERLCSIKSDCVGTRYEDIINEMIEEEKDETKFFRIKIEEIQLQLTSPTLESNHVFTQEPTDKSDLKDACIKMWKIFDRVTLLKRQIAEAVHTWNMKIQDFVSVRKKDDKVTKLGMSTNRSLNTTVIQSPKFESSYKASEDGSSNRSLERQDSPTQLSSFDSSVICVSCAPEKLASESQQDTSEERDESVNETKETSSFSAFSIPGSTNVSHAEYSTMATSMTNATSDDLILEKVFRRSISADSLRLHLIASQAQTISSIKAGNQYANETKNLILPTPEEQDLEPLIDHSESTAAKNESHQLGETIDSESLVPIQLNSGSKDDHVIHCSSESNMSGASSGYGDNWIHCKDHQSTETKPITSSYNELDNGIHLKGHGRSRSDGSERILSSKLLKLSSAVRSDDENSLERARFDKKDKPIMKTLISQLLPGSPNLTISSPFSPTEHFLFYHEEKQIPVIVKDKDPGSIIAYALTTKEYEQQLHDLKHSILTASSKEAKEPKDGKDVGQQSPTVKRKLNIKSQENVCNSSDAIPTPNDNSPMDLNNLALAQESEKTGYKQGSNYNIEIQFSDSTSQFYCRIYYAEHFRKLRRLVFPEGEERYIRSLAHCVPWLARGGKSGSSFSKTHDDRFILKQMSKPEIQYFLQNFAPYYFQYISKACTEQRPTVLTKIVGVYCIVYKNTATNTASKMDLLVMENLFYGRNITQKFDLKGSVRNRMVNTSSQQEGDIVLLDENLIKMTCDCPLYIRPHSKTVLTNAINNDTQFLASQSIMDYSLLVGVDEEKKELVVGIIDYIRTFTWDKKLECVVKTAGILGGHGKLPTVVSPDLYRIRFCEAMDRYFLWVPDRWSGLGEGVDG